MAVDLEAALPPLLQQRLGAARGDVKGLAVPVCTVDPEGLPHPAMLSYSELSSDDPQTLRAVVHETSRTARHLRERAVMTLLFVDPDTTCYVKARVTGPAAPRRDEPGLLEFTLAVVAVLADRPAAHERAAVITSGIRFERIAEGG